MTDRYTDELFAFPETAATTIAFPMSRLVVDPERFTDDALEPMSRIRDGRHLHAHGRWPPSAPCSVRSRAPPTARALLVVFSLQRRFA